MEITFPMIPNTNNVIVRVAYTATPTSLNGRVKVKLKIFHYWLKME